MGRGSGAEFDFMSFEMQSASNKFFLQLWLI